MQHNRINFSPTFSPKGPKSSPSRPCGASLFLETLACIDVPSYSDN